MEACRASANERRVLLNAADGERREIKRDAVAAGGNLMVQGAGVDDSMTTLLLMYSMKYVLVNFYSYIR